MDKNPFQIRTELLKQAQEIATADYYRELNKAETLFNCYVNKGEIPEAKKVIYPSAPTAADIIKVATELNNFISVSFRKS
jgi:hypothetical protein